MNVNLGLQLILIFSQLNDSFICWLSTQYCALAFYSRDMLVVLSAGSVDWMVIRQSDEMDWLRGTPIFISIFIFVAILHFLIGPKLFFNGTHYALCCALQRDAKKKEKEKEREISQSNEMNYIDALHALLSGSLFKGRKRNEVFLTKFSDISHCCICTKRVETE